MIIQDKNNLVDVNAPTCEDYQIYRRQWELLRDAVKGDAKIKYEKTKYLPEPNNLRCPSSKGLNNNGRTEYEAFQQLTSFPEILSQSLKGMLGLAFSEDSVLKLSNRLEYLRESCSFQNDTTFMSMYKKALSESLLMGRYGILLEPSENSQEVKIVGYTTENIFYVHYNNYGLDYVILRDFTSVFDESTETMKDEPFYIVLEVVDGVYRQTKKDKDFKTEEFVEVSFFGKYLDYIPFFVITPSTGSMSLESSPLSPIAEKSLHIYRNTAVLNKSLINKCDPIFYTFGIDDMGGSVSPGLGGNVITSNNPDIKIGYAEIQGDGIQKLKDLIESDIKECQSYAGKLIDVGGSNESGESLRQRRLMSEISLTSVIKAVSIQLTRLLDSVAFIHGDMSEENEFVGFSDFTSKIESVDDLVKALSLLPTGIVSRRSLHELASKQGITSMTFEEEQELIAQENDEL